MKKFLTLILALILCCGTCLMGCSSNDHTANATWEHDDYYHWQQCEECGTTVNMNEFYAKNTLLKSLTNSNKLPLKADNPDEYAKLFVNPNTGVNFVNFDEYKAVVTNGKAPHYYGADGVCVCGAEGAPNTAGPIVLG